MIKEFVSDIKRKFKIPQTKEVKDLYIVKNKETGEKIIDSSGEPLLILKHEILKLRSEYEAVPLIDGMKESYEKKLQNQREKMEYESLLDEEKMDVLRKRLK